MKKIILPVMVLAALASCNKPAPAVVDTTGDQNKAVVQNYLAAVVAGDTTHLESFLADTFKGYGPGMKDSVNRQQEVDSYKQNWRNDWVSVKYERDATQAFTIAAGEKNPGNWVAEWGVVTLEHKTGPSNTFRWHGVFRMVDGKIDLSVSFYDVNDILVQRGFTMTPPAAPAEKKK